MKNFKFLGIICLLVGGLMFVSCTSEPIPGPQGVAGIDGVDGQNGQNGQDGTDGEATCVACHSQSHRAPINASYLLSGHAAGGAVGYAGGRASCTQCHSNEGFIDWMDGKPGVDRTDQTPVSCVTCHSKHSTFDFENDGYDHALRNFDPVTLITDAAVTIDFGDLSNICTNCHQPRRTGPIDDGNGTFTVTSTHWGPHHGPQATFLEGIQGAHLIGSEVYPAPMSATHRTGATCTSCHMGETTDGTDGDHTWVPTVNGCTNCHSNPPSELNGFADELATLATLLEAVTGVDGNGDEVHGIVHDGHPQRGTFTLKEAQAAWNYLLIMEDASMGIHNPAYARALIKNSIEALQ
jgi:hypothetical protein